MDRVEVPHHFYDLSGNSLETFDPVWNDLAAWYKEFLPDRVTVEYCADGFSRFDPERDAIILDISRRTPLNPLVAHETSHVALSHMTKGASNSTPFRFIDEGWASIVERRIAGDDERYRKFALLIAGAKNHGGQVSFAKIEDWASYFGTCYQGPQNPPCDFEAYQVGSSFLYFFIDTYGDAKMRDLFLDLGTTKDLGKSFLHLLGKSKAAIEEGWRVYVGNAYAKLLKDPAAVDPAIASSSPAGGATEVDAEIGTLRITFNVPMGDAICVVSKSSDISYQQARWANEQTLEISLPHKLQPDQKYTVQLGSSNRGCFFRSKIGKPLPVTKLEFSTAKKADPATTSP